MAKRKRSAKQKANDKRLGARSKRISAKSSGPKRRKSSKRKGSRKINKRSNPRRKNVARKKSRSRSRSATGSIKGFFSGSSLLGKLAMGIGAGSIAGLALNAIAPQFTGVGKLGTAFLVGGPIGGIGQLLLGGGEGLGGLGSAVQGLIPQQRTEGAPASTLTV